MDARSFGVGLLAATTIFAAAGCSGSSETSTDVQRTSPPTAPASAGQTESATEAEREPAASDEGDGDYSAISGTWTGDLIWKPHAVEAAGSPFYAELKLEKQAEPRSPVGRLVERPNADGEATCIWTVYAKKATAPTYEIAATGGGSCDNGSMELELDEERDVLVVDGSWPQGTWDGELTREAGS